MKLYIVALLIFIGTATNTAYSKPQWYSIDGECYFEHTAQDNRETKEELSCTTSSSIEIRESIETGIEVDIFTLRTQIMLNDKITSIYLINMITGFNNNKNGFSLNGKIIAIHYPFDDITLSIDGNCQWDVKNNKSTLICNYSDDEFVNNYKIEGMTNIFDPNDPIVVENDSKDIDDKANKENQNERRSEFPTSSTTQEIKELLKTVKIKDARTCSSTEVNLNSGKNRASFCTGGVIKMKNGDYSIITIDPNFPSPNVIRVFNNGKIKEFIFGSMIIPTQGNCESDNWNSPSVIQCSYIINNSKVLTQLNW